MYRFSALPERRSALSFSCLALSSPLAYSVFLSPIFISTCRARVDFPIPGSPPNKTKLPGTNPPPNTRFSSDDCISRRISSFASTSCKRCACDPRRKLAPPFLVDMATLTSSSYVPHSPQTGQRPIICGDWAPQLEHTYFVEFLAIKYQLSPFLLLTQYFQRLLLLRLKTLYDRLHER